MLATADAYSRAKHARLLLFGTSIGAACDESAREQRPCADDCSSNLSGSFGYWLGMYAGDRVERYSSADCYRTNNFSLSGDTIVNMATPARLRPLLDRIIPGETVIVHQGGDNDIAAGYTQAQIEPALLAIWKSLLNAGAIVVYPTIFPRGGPYAFGPAQADLARSINALARAFALKNTARGFAVADLDGVMTEPSALRWAVRDGYLQDGVHPSVIGGSAIAWAITQQIRRFVPCAYAPPPSPRGNLLANGMLRGSDGLLQGGATGISPTGWLIDAGRAGGATVSAAQVVRPGGRTAIALSISGTSVGGEVWLSQALAQPGKIAVGDVLRARMHVSLGANRNIVGLPIRLATREAGIWRYCLGGSPFGNATLLPEGFATLNDPVPLTAPDRVVNAVPSEAMVSLIIMMPNLGRRFRVAATVFVEHAELRKGVD